MDHHRLGQLLHETGILLELRDGTTREANALQSLANQIVRHPQALDAARENWPDWLKAAPVEARDRFEILLARAELPELEELRAAIPPGFLQLLQLPDFTPARVRLLHEKLAVENVEDLEAACRADRVAPLAHFDTAAQTRMLESVRFWRANADRHHLHVAWVAANPILDRLRNLPEVIRCSVAGDLRRWTPTVPGISFVVSATRTDAVIRFFLELPEIAQVEERDETRVRVVLEDGLRATLRVVSDRMFPFALAKYTGSAAHYEALCERARSQGLHLDEFGLSRGDGNSRDAADRVHCHGEEKLHYALDMDYIPPEMREDRGEFAAAGERAIPPLLEWTALRGSLHNHSDWSDGRQTLAELASQAYDMGFSYWAATDHSKSAFANRGFDHKRLIAQINEIELINQQYQDAERPFRLLSGIEVDIRAGGRLDFEDEILAQLDVVIASIHQSLSGNEAEMTRRLIAAAENRQVQILGHLTGRLLLQREGYPVDHRAVIDACAATGTWIELNANPWRFDMDWEHWHYARERGVKCVINTNSHRAEHAQYLLFGAHVARKGWLTKHDVVNTLPLKHLRNALLEKRRRR